MIDDLIARIQAEKWHMVIDYVPGTRTFIVNLAGGAWGQGQTMELAIMQAIHEMDRHDRSR